MTAKQLYFFVVFAALSASTVRSYGQSREVTVVETSTDVLNEIMAVPARNIPQSMLANAQGIAIIPNVVKGGFVVGVRHGRGVLLIRDQSGAWSAPQFVTLTGGSVGWQIGMQSTDVILVFKTRNSVNGLSKGKFTIGLDASVAAGPVGREAAAATDVSLKAEIYSYSRSRGLFAGVALDGSALQIDTLANQMYYGAPPVGPGTTRATNQPAFPPSAVNLIQLVTAYSESNAVAGRPILTNQPAGISQQPAGVTQQPAGPSPVPSRVSISAPATGTSSSVESLRNQLVQASIQLHGLLDEPWRRYLALPSGVFQPNGRPNEPSMRLSLSHFDTVVGDARYAALTRREEFRNVHNLLKWFASRLSAPGGSLTLPSPPSGSSVR